MKAHDVAEVRFRGSELIVNVDGHEHVFQLTEVSPRLAAASAEAREHFEVSASGYGIHWALLDEDLSIDGLLGISHRPAPSQALADDHRATPPASAP